jgi:hypothetical protein
MPEFALCENGRVRRTYFLTKILLCCKIKTDFVFRFLEKPMCKDTAVTARPHRNKYEYERIARIEKYLAIVRPIEPDDAPFFCLHCHTSVFSREEIEKMCHSGCGNEMIFVLMYRNALNGMVRITKHEKEFEIKMTIFTKIPKFIDVFQRMLVDAVVDYTTDEG